MLAFISWKHFLVFLLISLMIYYAVIYLLYFRQQRKRTSDALVIKAEKLTQEFSNEFDLMMEIQLEIQQAKRDGTPREELLYGLQQQLKAVNDHDSDFRKKVEQEIQLQMQQMKLHGLEADELAGLWRP
ncbi:MAG: hypothetical protein IBJ16_09390 [Chitinophagaceae bacterium]|nr:hypothetical protein [Chitinophagaceae bacterium]